MKTILLLAILSATFLYAAEPDRIVTSGVHLVAQASKSDPHPLTRRTYQVQIANKGKVNEEFEVLVYWFSGTTVTQSKKYEFPRFVPTATNGFVVALDVAQESGWAAVARRKTGELLAATGSGKRFEMLARTADAVAAK